MFCLCWITTSRQKIKACSPLLCQNRNWRRQGGKVPSINYLGRAASFSHLSINVQADQTYEPTSSSTTKLLSSKHRWRKLLPVTYDFTNPTNGAFGSEYLTWFSFCNFSNGEEAMRQSQYEKAVKCYSKAMTLQPKQVQSQPDIRMVWHQWCSLDQCSEVGSGDLQGSLRGSPAIWGIFNYYFINCFTSS